MRVTTAASSMSPEGIFDMVLEHLNYFPFEYVRDKQDSARFTRISCWEKKKFWDFCCIINSHAAKSGDLRSSQSFFQDLGYAEVNLSVSNDNYLLPDQSWFSLSDVFLIK